MQTSHAEGIIKFDLNFSLAAPPRLETIAELNAWRQILHSLGLIGCDPKRYQGFAYGNVSRRAGPDSFIVSGTQTGGKTFLNPGDYCQILNFDLEKNYLFAEGPVKPSSEALTHAAVYAANQGINCVLHIHSPILWRNSKHLGLCQTDAAIAYGTPGMAQAVGQLAYKGTDGLVSMGGHEDGLLAFSDTISQAGINLVKCLAQAEELELLAHHNRQLLRG